MTSASTAAGGGVSARALALARELVRLPTAGSGEAAAADLCAEVLTAAGWEVELLPFAPGRAQVIARAGEGPIERCLCGHLDTVGTGEGSWTVDPFSGLVADGSLWGRGAADMKGGVGAIVAAGESLSLGDRMPGAGIVLTAAEETGAQGAAAIAGHTALARVREWVVAEPTANRVLTGHKGALWLSLRCAGETGHASAPPAGGGAIGELRRALDRIASVDLGSDLDPLLGWATLAITGLRAGSAPNVAPGEAHAVIDVRFTGSLGCDELERRIRAAVGPEVRVEPISVLPAVSGSPASALARETARLSGGDVAAHGASYFTDLSQLARPGASTVIVGPGEPGQAHVVDERCGVDAIGVAAGVYRGLLGAGGSPAYPGAGWNRGAP